MPTNEQEPKIAKNARRRQIKLIGITGLEFTIRAGGDDFSDNRERAADIVDKSRGTVKGVIKGEDPDARTGSFTSPFYTENNARADSILDVIRGQEAWEDESTGMDGEEPYCEQYCLTMEVTVFGYALDGGDMVTTYPKTRFIESVAGAVDKDTVTINWSCWDINGITSTGPTL